MICWSKLQHSKNLLEIHLLSTLTSAISGLRNEQTDYGNNDKRDDRQKNPEKQAQYQFASEAQTGYLHHEWHYDTPSHAMLPYSENHRLIFLITLTSCFHDDLMLSFSFLLNLGAQPLFFFPGWFSHYQSPRKPVL
jgi:hypothetical protein